MIYGWDISTSQVGLAVFKDDGTFTAAMHCDLRKEETLLAKADALKDFLNYTSVNVEKQSTHFIEERLGGFASGRTSAQTLMKLGAFNGIASYIIWTHLPGTHRQITYLHPSTWKALMKREGLIIPPGADKKECTLQFVLHKEPTFKDFLQKNRNDKWQPWSYDVADAWCLGKSGYRRLCIEKES